MYSTSSNYLNDIFLVAHTGTTAPRDYLNDPNSQNSQLKVLCYVWKFLVITALFFTHGGRRNISLDFEWIFPSDRRSGELLHFSNPWLSVPCYTALPAGKSRKLRLNQWNDWNSITSNIHPAYTCRWSPITEMTVWILLLPVILHCYFNKIKYFWLYATFSMWGDIYWSNVKLYPKLCTNFYTVNRVE